MLKKLMTWKTDIGMIIVVFVGFEIIDRNIEAVEHIPMYYDFLVTAKWLLIGGFTLHGIINFLMSRR